jgi:hypothetical protein
METLISAVIFTSGIYWFLSSMIIKFFKKFKIDAYGFFYGGLISSITFLFLISLTVCFKTYDILFLYYIFFIISFLYFWLFPGSIYRFIVENRYSVIPENKSDKKEEGNKDDDPLRILPTKEEISTIAEKAKEFNKNMEESFSEKGDSFFKNSFYVYFSGEVTAFIYFISIPFTNALFVYLTKIWDISI